MKANLLENRSRSHVENIITNASDELANMHNFQDENLMHGRHGYHDLPADVAFLEALKAVDASREQEKQVSEGLKTTQEHAAEANAAQWQAFAALQGFKRIRRQKR